MLTYRRESFQMSEKGLIQKLFQRKSWPDSFHLKVLESILIDISNFFKYNSCLVIDFTRFPYQEGCVNKWFDWDVNKDEEEEKTISVINKDQINREESVYSPQYGTESLNRLLDNDYRVLFHGTNHQGAKSITEDGILLNKGKKNQDFSSGIGFYLSSGFEEALEWACHRFARPAVVVYMINCKILAKYEGLDLQGKGKEKAWRKLVSHFRSGIQDEAFRRKTYKQHNYIEGPMASISRNYQDPKRKYNSYQFCILSEKLAEEFNTSLHSLLFYAK